MKNFRKVLALVLVVATLFSFVAMTASAKEYTDTDKVSYTEAVDVLSAIGILNGYPDGTFRPTNTIARAEMAKMVAVLSNAGDDISDLYTSACKFADMTGDAVWAKSYVAYCNEMGIVAGRNATTFDPYGKVTGIETAKMLLCLIGFDAKAQGYVGSNWKTHVLADAKNMGLLAGFASDYNADKAITREEAAQMMLNALKAPMVIGTLSKDIVNITNNVWLDENRTLIGVGIKDITLADAAKQYGWYVLYGNVVVSPKLVLTNYKGLHWGEDRDCYGNPVTEWSYDNSKGVEVWSAQYAMVPTYTSNEAVELETVLKDEIKGGKKYTVEFYVDGDLDDWWNGTDARTLNTADEATWNRLNAFTGRGVLTNVYVDDAKLQIVITIKNTYIGVVKDAVKYENTFSVVGTNNTWGVNTFSNAGYDFKTGDIILYWVCNNGCGTSRHLHDAQICTPVTGEVTMATTVRENNFATRLSKSDATVGGKTYNYAKNFNVTSTVEQRDIIYKPQTNTKDSVDLFLDTYGNIMGWRLTDDSVPTEFAYVVENSGRAYNYEGNGIGDDGFKDHEAKLVGYTTDKPTPTVTQTDVDLYDLVTDDYRVYNVGRLVSYQTVDETAELTGQATFAPVGAYLTAKGTLVDTTGRTITKGDDETKYMVRTYDYKAKDYVYTVYTGDLPASYASLATDTYGGTQYSTIQYFTKAVGTDNNTTYVDVLSYVFIDTLFTRVNTHAFILKSDKLIADYDMALIAPDMVVDGIHWGSFEQYTAIVNGVKGYLLLDPLEHGNLNLDGEEAQLVELGLEVIGYTYDGMPVYTNVTVPSATATGTHEYKYSNGMIYVDGKAYDAADDIMIAVCIPTSDGQELKVCESVAELNNYIEIYTGAHVDDTTGYVTVSGWFYDDGAGIDAEMTEIYINFSTQTIH